MLITEYFSFSVWCSVILKSTPDENVGYLIHRSQDVHEVHFDLVSKKGNWVR